jgi:DedD protein
MFKLRSGSQSGAAPAQTPTIESIRRQARHRLIGASVLVLVGIMGLPWLFDAQPRPVPVPIRVEIPAKDALEPLKPTQAIAPVEQVHEGKQEEIQPPPATLIESAPAVATPQPAVNPPKTVAPASQTRVVVQVGAFADKARAQEVRLRLERAGLKTYTHEANTSEGKRIRVRLGPFSSRAEAEKAAEKVKQLGLPAALLTL